MRGGEADAALNKVFKPRVREAHSDSPHTFCVSPRRPAGSENYTALPSSACLIAEVRRINIVHISKGWSADGRKLQKLSSGIEEAERSQWEARESRWRRCRERQPLTRTRRRAKCHLIVTAEKGGLAFPLAPRNMISDEFTPPECFLSPVYPKCLSPPWVMAEFPSLPFKTQSFHCDICTSTAITRKYALKGNNTEDYCYFVLFTCLQHSVWTCQLMFHRCRPPQKKIFILKAKSQQMCRNLLDIINLSSQVHFWMQQLICI